VLVLVVLSSIVLSWCCVYVWSSDEVLSVTVLGV